LPIQPLTPASHANCHVANVLSSPRIALNAPTRCLSIKDLAPQHVLLAPTKTTGSAFLVISLAFSVKVPKLVSNVLVATCSI
jgi:hypothetical protein